MSSSRPIRGDARHAGTRLAHSIAAVRRVVAAWHRQGLKVGIVPTMGALHRGHLSLIRRSKRLCDRTVVSIFVNPAQFGPGEDLDAYPRPLSRDLAACREQGVDLVFVPSVATMYPDGCDTKVNVGLLGDLWEGRSRPGHFDGVATVVLKLFSIVNPDVAIFGQKDFQQTVVIQRMVLDLNLPVRILVSPTVRERDGLALSSRNVYLNQLSRTASGGIYQSLRWAEEQIRRGETRVGQLKSRMKRTIERGGCFSLDYIGFCDPLALTEKPLARPPLVILVAAKCLTSGSAQNRRYIDNIVLRRALPVSSV
jgi:pantoate--beta-alanine ligase